MPAKRSDRLRAVARPGGAHCSEVAGLASSYIKKAVTGGWPFVHCASLIVGWQGCFALQWADAQPQDTCTCVDH